MYQLHAIRSQCVEQFHNYVKSQLRPKYAIKQKLGQHPTIQNQKKKKNYMWYQCEY